MLSPDITAKTIEEATDVLHNIENRSKHFQVQDNSLCLRSLRSNSPHGHDRPPVTSSLSWDRRSSEGGSRDYSPHNQDFRNNIPEAFSPNQDRIPSDNKSYNYPPRDRSREGSPHNRDRNFFDGRSLECYKYNCDYSYDHTL